MKQEPRTKEYFETWKQMKLSGSSRDRMKDELLSFARFHAVTEGVRTTEVGRSNEQVPQRTTFITRFYNLRITHMTAVILIALLIGGGTSYAAEHAVPGDLLYPIKVEINEEVKSVLAFSTEAEAELQVALARERLLEAQELAASGELDAEATEELSERLESHYEAVIALSEEEEKSGDLESSATVRASLEGTFRSYADILTQLNTADEEGASALITDIRAYAEVAANAQATATIDISADVSHDVEATVLRAEAIINEVEAEFMKASERMNAHVYTRLEAQFAKAIAAHAEAEILLEKRDYRDAYASAHTAIRIAHEVRAHLGSIIRFDVDVTTDESILDIIDVRVTDETDTNAHGTTSEDTQSNIENDAEDGGASGVLDVELDIEAGVEVDGTTGTLEVDAVTGSRIEL